MNIKFFVLLCIAIISSLNINTVKCYRVMTRSYYYGRPSGPYYGKPRVVHHKYSVEHIYEEEEPEKPKPKPEEPKPESKKDWTLGDLKVRFTIKKETFVPDVVDFIEKFNGRIQKSTIEAPHAIFENLPKESKKIKDLLEAKTVNKWEDQPEVSSAFEKIRGEMEKVYSVSEWEKPIQEGKDKGKVKQKQLWHKALFLLNALFQLYDKVLSELIKLVDKSNDQVSNVTCADKVKDLDKEKKCSKGLEALVKMNKENIEKIDDFYKLHDNFVKQTKAWNEFKEKIKNIFTVEIETPKIKFEKQKVKFTLKKDEFFSEIVDKIKLYYEKINREDKVTDAAETIYAFPKLFRDWLRQKTSDWKEQPEATKAFNYVKEEITKSYSLKEEITRLNAQRNWPYHLFLLHTLFEFFESIFAEARKQISSKNNAVINQICDEKLSEKESEKCVDWLNNQSKILEKCNVKIETVFSARFKNLLDKWEDYSKNIKGIFEVEIVAGDAPAPSPEAPKVRKVIKKVRGREYYHPESFEYNPDEYIYDHPRHYGPPRHHGDYRFMPYGDSFEVKGNYHYKSGPKRIKYSHQATYKYKGK